MCVDRIHCCCRFKAEDPEEVQSVTALLTKLQTLGRYELFMLLVEAAVAGNLQQVQVTTANIYLPV